MAPVLPVVVVTLLTSGLLASGVADVEKYTPAEPVIVTDLYASGVLLLSYTVPVICPAASPKSVASAAACPGTRAAFVERFTLVASLTGVVILTVLAAVAVAQLTCPKTRSGFVPAMDPSLFTS